MALCVNPYSFLNLLTADNPYSDLLLPVLFDVTAFLDDILIRATHYIPGLLNPMDNFYLCMDHSLIYTSCQKRSKVYLESKPGEGAKTQVDLPLMLGNCILISIVSV